MPICRSSGACEVWMIECYKYSAPLALRCEDIDSNDLLFAHSSRNCSKEDCGEEKEQSYVPGMTLLTKIHKPLLYCC
jgi:hypothetical protein